MDLLESFDYVLSPAAYPARRGGYYTAIEADPATYVRRRPGLVAWLQRQRSAAEAGERQRKVVLVTNSHGDYATVLASHALACDSGGGGGGGGDWRALFDLVVVLAEKPGWFQSSDAAKPSASLFSAISHCVFPMPLISCRVLLPSNS